MRIDPDEFRSRSLRVHTLLHDVPLEDTWAIPLSGGDAGRTIQDVRAALVAGREAGPRSSKGSSGCGAASDPCSGGIINVPPTTLNPHRALPPSARLSGRHSKSAACVGRTL
jgi:hypothetical protein